MKTLPLAALAALTALPAAAHTEATLHVHHAETGSMILAGAMVVVALALTLRR
ncbi:hypothetical protein SAMN05421759_11446 [Roseivivax lentus]|uniref:Peptidase M23 n=1 Tax=Roseivivax lentus TaxID=633194 RepID=A0A1N7PBR0_9RHOB|nr:hypothetical protein [Roseivivax lentus]SIT07937.1 hypothetical protein SAMN05421759_11446 [Roseivivax lentus]